MHVIRDGCANEMRNTKRCITKFIVHSVFLILNLYTLYFLMKLKLHFVDGNNNIDIRVKKAFKYCVHYISHWNLVFQTLFLALSVAHDVVEWNKARYTTKGFSLRFTRDVIYLAMVIPNTLYVFVLFWSTYLIDRETGYPKHLDDVIPNWSNHSVHTVILVVVVVEMWLEPRRQPIHRAFEYFLISFLEVVYLIQLYLVYYFKGYWIYPILGSFGIWRHILHIVLTYILKVVFHRGSFIIANALPKETDAGYGIELVDQGLEKKKTYMK